MQIHAIAALADNYIWALVHEGKAIIVDPGEAAAALDFLQQHNLALQAILLTHKHADHVDGVPELVAAYPAVPVYAPLEAKHYATAVVAPGATATVAQWPTSFTVHASCGHTAGHLSYVDATVLLCGDALFSCGCGRLFEGTPADLAASMDLFLSLPPSLQICCGHEYTLGNIAFAKAVEPDNAELRAWAAKAMQLREQGQPTLPTTLEFESQVNPFLRAAVPTVHQAAANYAGHELTDTTAVLAALRSWKDNF